MRMACRWRFPAHFPYDNCKVGGKFMQLWLCMVRGPFLGSDQCQGRWPCQRTGSDTSLVQMGGTHQIPDTQLQIRLWIWSSYGHDCNLNIACASIGEAVTRARSRNEPWQQLWCRLRCIGKNKERNAFIMPLLFVSSNISLNLSSRC